ncbi:MAG: helicase C-terminal domain-containing protein [Halioglobus sp.]|nr:helicase C-terminal domain-containing protein [Halioglobus sp.]
MARDPACLQRDPPLRDAYFDILQLLRVAEQWGPEYRLQMTRGEGRQSLRVTLHCLDPARLLAKRQSRGHAVVAFSATLSPLPWTRACLGLREETVCHRASSPFQPHQLRVRLATGLDTRYRQREATLPALVDLLRHWLADNPGNCIVYFPAYRYLEDCLALLEREPLERTLWVQRREDDADRREQLLAQLRERRDLAAFCILGGVFGEGIDLPGEQLTSVVVVGLGMPQVNHHTRELQQWYERATAAGFDYTFVYPGMQKVAQALGRVVRCIGDSGSALLIDPRYGQSGYRALLPPWWEYRDWREKDSDAE